tara:strand:- start:968 stop:1132 length:165 start_codon:yes stop_codon:yes gene_type:complete
MYYAEYSDLEKDEVDYILTVSGASKITDLSLIDINDFFNSLNQWEGYDGKSTQV